MRPGYSRLLINEFVVPEVGASDFLTSVDLMMMAMSGGMERTERQWTELLGRAGLRIDRIWKTVGVEDVDQESVIEATLVT